MSADSVVGIAWDVLKSNVVVPIERGFRYVVSSKSFANRLRDKVHNLENEARRVHDLAQVARNNLRILNGCFTDWRQNADKALDDAQNLLDAYDKASKTCCRGTLPDPKCRYRFSREAEAKIEVVQLMAQNCIRFRAVDDICLSGPAPADPTPARIEGKDAILSFESRVLMCQKIMDALASKSNSAVGVYGMGGLGKSTILDEVERMLRGKKSFDWIAKADVSENPNIKMIQGEIANGLGLTRIKEEETISGRAKLLRLRLEDEERQEKKVLIILDNLWKGLDLKSVGIPCGFDNKVKGCQLLLTSRHRDVLREEMRCDEAFQLYGLEKAEAKILFERIGGDGVHEDDFEALVDKALDKCAGVPFLIVAMAKRFKDASLTQWKDTVKNIEEFTDKKINNLIDHMLQWSYDNLEEEEKSLLRLCVVYGVSEPSLQNLVKYGFGLGIFQRVSSMEEARNRLSSHIRTLQTSSLLLDSEDVASFKIHDLVREFVVSKASSDHPLLVLKDKDKLITELPKDKLKSYWAICFPYVDMERLPDELDCSDLQNFLLFTNNKSLHVPDSFFNSMRKLMVISLTGIYLTHLPLSFKLLKNLHTLCLDNCWLEDVTILGEVKSLQILSLVSSRIQRLPKEIGQLVELRLLDLSRCLQLKIIEPDVLGRLIKLEELYMNSSFDEWNAVEKTPPTNASLIELNNIKSLSTLHLSISNPSALPGDLDVEKLKEYRIRIGFVNWRRGECKGSTTLELNLERISNVLQKGCIQSILDKTDDLFLYGFDALVQSICTLSQKGFPQLKHLHVDHSPSVHYIIEHSSLPTFKKLETLVLYDLVNLEKICHNRISITSFNTLKVVRVIGCDKMEVLFPLSVMRGLPQLEEIEIAGCKMCGIVEVDDCGKLEFPKLRVLELRDLPNIKSFFTDGLASSSRTSYNQVGTQIAFFDGQQVAFPSLEELLMSGLDNIELIWDSQVAADSFHTLNSLRVDECNRLKRIWHKEHLHQVKFPCPRSIHISGCINLASLFLASVARDLIQLEELTIDDCGIVKLIEKEEGLVLRSVLPQLTSLKLTNLTELKCIYAGTHALCWPALKTLKVQGCNKVEMLASQLENKRPLQRQPLFSIEKVAFRRLETLEIIGLDDLRFIFFPSVVESLSQVRDLTVSKCNKVEAIIMVEEGSGLKTTATLGSPIESEVAFHQLKYIKLDGLRELRCFSSSGCNLMFPLLEDVIVSDCPNMHFFSDGLIKAPNLERVQAIPKEFSKSTKPQNFWEGNLNIAVQNMFEEMGTHAGVKEMWLSELPKLIGKWQTELNPIKSYWQLNSLVIDKYPFVNAIPPKLMLALDNLCTLQVLNNELLEEIFDLEGQEVMENTRALPRLNSLTLGYLPKLRQLWNKDLQGMLRFNSLSQLTLYKCSNLRHVFTPSMVQCVASLQYMNINECGQMEKVIAEEEGQESATENITLPNLRGIELKCLPNLTSFISGKNHMLECPKIQVLTIAHFPKMRSLTSGASLFTSQVQFPWLKLMALSHMDNLSKIWIDSPQENLTFDYLKKVDAQNCKSLVNLFPYCVATSLNQVEELRVEFCEMEEIVAGGDDIARTNTSQVLFPKLTSLVLHDMPQLKSFCPNLPTLNWPLMEELRVTHCSELNKLCLVASMNNWAQSDDQQHLLDQEAQSSFERGFPIIERVLLVEKDIQMIEGGKFPNDIFGKPKAITLACFHDENAVFPPRFFLERFQNLQSLEIFCCSFEDIFPDEELVDEVKHLVLESLTELKLSKLPNLKRAWREDSLVSKILQNITTFEIRDCPDLTTIFPMVTSFHNLTKLVVENSSGLVNLISISAVTNLVHLTEMTIIGCERMKEVVEDGENGEGKMISFEKLEDLTLQQLPSLECFSSTTSCSFRFPSLWQIDVEECPKMKIFSKSMLQTPKLYRASLFGYYRVWDGGDLNTFIQKLSA